MKRIKHILVTLFLLQMTFTVVGQTGNYQRLNVGVLANFMTDVIKWDNDTIYKDSLYYVQVQGDSARFKALGSTSWSDWVGSGSGDSYWERTDGQLSPITATDTLVLENVKELIKAGSWDLMAMDGDTVKYLSSDSLCSAKNYYTLQDSVINNMDSIVNHTTRYYEIIDSINRHTDNYYTLQDSVKDNIDSLTNHSGRIVTLEGSGHDAVTIGTANGLSLVGQQLSLALASTSTVGALSLTDWNTFNSKLTSPLTTLGDILYFQTVPARLPIGSEDKVLTSKSGIPSWETASGGIFSGTTGQYYMPYASATDVFANSGMLSNGTTNSMGISPSTSKQLFLYNAESTITKSLAVEQWGGGSTPIAIHGYATVGTVTTAMGVLGESLITNGQGYGLVGRASGGTTPIGLWIDTGKSRFDEVADYGSPIAASKILALNASNGDLEYIDYSDFGSGGTFSGSTDQYYLPYASANNTFANSILRSNSTNLALGKAIDANISFDITTGKATGIKLASTITGLSAVTGFNIDMTGASSSVSMTGQKITMPNATDVSLRSAVGLIEYGGAVNEGTTSTKVLTLDASNYIDYRTPLQILNDGGAGIASIASGSLAYWNGTAWVNLGKGADGQMLYTTSSLPAWGAAPTGTGGVTSSGMTTGYLTMNTASSTKDIGNSAIRATSTYAAIGQAPSSDTKFRITSDLSFATYISNTYAGTNSYGTYYNISGSTNPYAIYVNAGDTYLKKLYLNSLTEIASPAATDKVIITDGTEAKYVEWQNLPSGGVGTSSPSELLFNSSGSVDGTSGVSESSGGLRLDDSIELGFGSSAFDIRFIYSNAADAVQVQNAANNTLYEIQDANKLIEYQNEIKVAFGSSSEIAMLYNSSNTYLEWEDWQDNTLMTLNDIGTTGELDVTGTIDASLGFKVGTDIGIDDTFISGTQTFTVTKGIITSVASSLPKPEPSQSSIYNWTEGIDHIEYQIEYTHDYKQLRKTTKYYQKGLLVEAKPGNWQRNGFLSRLLLN